MSEQEKREAYARNLLDGEQEKPLCAKCHLPESFSVHHPQPDPNCHAYVPAEPPAAPRARRINEAWGEGEGFVGPTAAAPGLLGFNLKTDPSMPRDGVRLRSEDGKKVTFATNCAAPDSPPAAQPLSAREWMEARYEPVPDTVLVEAVLFHMEAFAAQRTAALEQELVEVRGELKETNECWTKEHGSLLNRIFERNEEKKRAETAEQRIAELKAALRKLLGVTYNILSGNSICNTTQAKVQQADLRALNDADREARAALGKGKKMTTWGFDCACGRFSISGYTHAEMILERDKHVYEEHSWFWRWLWRRGLLSNRRRKP